MSPEALRWRNWLLAACAVSLAAGIFCFFVGTPALPWAGNPGFDWANTSKPYTIAITRVNVGGAGDRAGLRAGDEVDLRDTSFNTRFSLRYIQRGFDIFNEPLAFIVHRGAKTQQLVVSPSPDNAWPAWSAALAAFFGTIWLVVLATLLAARRPDLPEARALAIYLLLYSDGTLTAELPERALLGYLVATHVCASGAVVAFALFVSCFGRPLSLIRRALNYATALVASIALALTLFDITALALLVPDPTKNVWRLYEFSIDKYILLFPLASTIAATIASRGVERQRVLWVSFAVTPFWLAVTALAPITINGASEFQTLNTAFTYVGLTVPLVLTYAVLSRRLLDIGFVLNRAAVFAGVSLVLLSAFVLVEWLLTDWLRDAGHVTNVVVIGCLAVALGLSVRFVHTRVDRFVDYVFFRKRHEAESAIRRFAAEAPFITDQAILVERTIAVLHANTDAEAVRIALTDRAGRYGGVSENDPAIVRLRATPAPLDLHAVESELEGEIAFPMMARGELVGVLVLGPRTSGEAYAPDETSAILQTAHSVGSAVDALSSTDGSRDGVLDAIHGLGEQLRALPDAIVARLRDSDARND